jgi:glycerophosphoryl diester phosphodiesterase
MTSLFAHRGHHRLWPENSVAAVAAAREIGAEGVEIDVWLTADKYLIVNHDRSLGGRSLPASTLDEIRGRRAVATPALLGDVLEAAGDLRINVEIKSTRSGPYNAAVAEAVARFLDDAPVSSQCLVSSFSLAICEEVRRRAPARKVGWLVHRQPAAAVLDQVTRSGLTSAHLPFSRVNPEIALEAERRDLELHVWTPNLGRDIGRMLELRVGAIITDDVPLARQLRAGVLGDDD